LIDAEDVARALRDDTLLVSVMLANNEIGAIQPIAAIGRVCKERGVLFHCDATQAVGKLPVDVETLQVDLLSLSAHKLYGPKGVGALYVRRRNPIVRLEPRTFGGGQERGFRSGTLNVPGIVGLGTAVEIATQEMDTERARLTVLRQRLFDGLTRGLDDVSLNGPPLEAADLRLPGNLNLAFAYVQGEALLLEIKELAVSSGAACTSVDPEPSHVLRVLGLDDDLTKASLRFGLGRFNTEEEVDFAIERVADAVARLRKLSSGS
jgi:cysteine desulfurase